MSVLTYLPILSSIASSQCLDSTNSAKALLRKKARTLSISSTKSGKLLIGLQLRNANKPFLDVQLMTTSSSSGNSDRGLSDPQML